MTEPLQDFSFKSNSYQRPTCEWTCGRASEDAACQLGPSRKGQCHNTNTCQPELVGEEYRCTRSILDGGPCEDGAFPDGRCGQKDERCQPVRSIRSRRRLVTVWLSAFVFGLCVWMFGSASPSDLSSPGELTFQHRGISQDCSSCHTASEGDEQHWVMSAFHSNIAINDSNKCLKCHQDLGENPFNSHGLSQQRISELTNKYIEKSTENNRALSTKIVANFFGNRNDGQLACATCHHEHRGIDHNLKTMSNNQCASCHTNHFEHIGKGHPEFTDFPYERRTRIYFDHVSHFKNYFSNFQKTGTESFSCSSCHQPDAAKRTMLTKGFENSCAKCHETQIKDLEFPGVAFLQLPPLDLSVFSEKKIAIGEWPSVGNAKRLSKLPAFMKLLLESDPNFTTAMKDLGEFDFRDIENFLETKPESVSKLLWSIKKLFHDVKHNGQSELEKRLAKQSLAELVTFDPVIFHTIDSAQQDWFPNLEKEYAEFTGKTLTGEVNASVSPKKTAETFLPETGGWYRDNTDLSIRYRPTGHSDRFLKNWLDLNASLSESATADSRTRLQRIFENPSASGGSATQGPVASGRCILCHTIDENKDGKLRVNWFAKPSGNAHRGLNKFSHSPHITVGTQTCVSCHRWESSSARTIYRKEFLNFDPQSRGWKFESKCTMPNTSGFAPLGQKKCATCHNGQSTGDNCLKCHNYHHR